MTRPAALILLAAALALAACADPNDRTPLPRYDQSSYVGAPGGNAP